MRLIEVLKSIEERTDWSPETIADILKKWDEKLINQGIRVRNELGSGTKGVAYSLGNKVLKITMDETEANAASILIGKKLKNVCEFYRVFEFDKTGYFGIVEEKLNRIEWGGGGSFLSEMLDHDSVQSAIDRYSIGKINDETLKEELMDALMQQSSAKLAPSSYVDEAEKGLLDVANGLFELKQYGINYHDVYSANVMQRKNKNYVIIDLGYSRSARGNIEEI